MPRRIELTLFVLVVACHSDPVEQLAPEAGSPRTMVVPPSSSSLGHHHRGAVDAGLDPLCATLLQEEKLDETALHEEDKASPGPRMRCFAAGNVAWAVRADRGDAGSSIRQTILFGNKDGARARLASTVDGVEWPPVLGRRSAAFDFDGDGVPEFFTTVSKDVRTFAPASRVFVTYKKGAIAPYPTGAYQVDGFADVDRDGRPDLRVSFDVGKRTMCAPTDEGRVEVDLVAHSLPDGKFSLTDAVAVDFATKRCPAMPTAGALLTGALPSAEADLSLKAIACERLRGKSSDAVVADVNAACASSTDAAKKCSGPCRHLPDALAVARFTPPIQLK